jgi:competence protein ComEA
MIVSLLIKLAMVALTMGVIFWIGWTVPQPELDTVLAVSEQPPQTSHAEEPVVAAPIPSPIRQAVKPVERSSVGKEVGKLDLNQATERDLEMLPGIGAVLAGRIVKHRQGIGSFTRIEDLREVKGIGKKKFDKIKDLVRVTVRRSAQDGENSA